jgi:hypothetical protein
MFAAFHKNSEHIEISLKIMNFFGLCSREEYQSTVYMLMLRRSEPFTTQGMPISISQDQAQN